MSDIKIDQQIENVCDVEILELSNNQDDLIKVAECISDCFVGVNVDGVTKSEPMNMSLKMERTVVNKFILSMLEEIVQQKFCFFARDLKTGHVVAAILAQVYDPKVEIQRFTGEFEPYNRIFDFLGELDRKFKEWVERDTKRMISKGEYLHINVVGIKVKGKNKNIFKEFCSVIESKAKESGIKGIFVEATNPKSQVPFIEKFDYINPVDKEGMPILIKYKDFKEFMEIPEEIAVDCKLLYKSLF